MAASRCPRRPRRRRASGRRKRKKLFIGFAAAAGARRRRLLGLRGPARRIRHDRQCLCRRRHRPGDAARRRPVSRGCWSATRKRSRPASRWSILDQTDARLAVAEAEAAYDQARRRVTGYVATDRQLAAQIACAAPRRAAPPPRSSRPHRPTQRARHRLQPPGGAGRNRRVSGEELTSTRGRLTSRPRPALSAARAAQAQASSSQRCRVRPARRRTRR